MRKPSSKVIQEIKEILPNAGDLQRLTEIANHNIVKEIIEQCKQQAILGHSFTEFDGELNEEQREILKRHGFKINDLNLTNDKSYEIYWMYTT